MDYYGSPRMCFSTQDYNEACGYSHGDYKISIERIFNDKNVRSIIEEELQKIPTSEQNNLIILLTRGGRYSNSELLQENGVLLKVKIIKKYEKESVLRLVNKDLDYYANFEQYTPGNDETWDTFDNTPFYLHCDKCDNITNKNSRGFSESTYCLFCNTEVYLEVPFCEKEEAKKLGAMWDVEFKKWYIFNGDINKELILQKWKTCQKNCVENKSLFPGRLLDKKIIETITHKVYLEVPFCEKEDAKKLGVKWDSEFKKWYIFNENINKDLILQKWKVTIPVDQMLI